MASSEFLYRMRGEINTIGHAVAVFTASKYAIRSICYWAGSNYTRGWACANGDLLEIIAQIIKGRKAAITFTWLTPADTSKDAYLAAHKLAIEAISSLNGPIYELPLLSDFTSVEAEAFSATYPLTKVSTTLPAEDPPKAKVVTKISAKELAIVEKPDAHRSRFKCV